MTRETSYNIIQWLIKNRSLNDVLYDCTSSISIEHALKNNDAAYQPTVDEVKERHIDGDYSIVIGIHNDTHEIAFIIGQGEFQSDDNECWTPTDILYNTTEIETVKRLLQWSKSRCYLYCIDLKNCDKRKKKHSYGRPYAINDTYYFERAKDLRVEKVFHLKCFNILKQAVLSVDVNIDTYANIDSMYAYIEQLYEFMYNEFVNRGIFNKRLSYDLTVKDMEYDVSRGKLYIDTIKCPLTYIDAKGNTQTERWLSAHVATPAVRWPNLSLDEDIKRQAFMSNRTLIARSFFAIYQALVKDKTLRMYMSNYAYNQFKAEWLKDADAYKDTIFKRIIDFR